MRILIVDDEKELVKTLSMGLRSKGFETYQALNGKQALEHLKRDSHQIDMVITDYIMPDMDGITLMKTIKKDYPSISVLMISADGTNRLIQEVLHGGGDGFMDKPFTIEELVREIQRTEQGRLTCRGTFQ